MWLDRLYCSFGGDFLHQERPGLRGFLLLWSGRIRQRRALAELDAALRRDVGLTTAQIDAEVAKPFWRA